MNDAMKMFCLVSRQANALRDVVLTCQDVVVAQNVYDTIKMLLGQAMALFEEVDHSALIKEVCLGREQGMSIEELCEEYCLNDRIVKTMLESSGT